MRSLLIAAVSLVYLAVGLATLPRYGTTWDENENFYTGEAHLHYLWSGERAYLEFESNQLHGEEALLYWEAAAEPGRYPPATNILAAATKHALQHAFPVASMDGYHALIVALGSLLVGLVMRVMLPRYGLLAALFSGAALGLHPRYFSDLHNNVKDLPETLWCWLAILCFWRAYHRPRWQWWLAASLFWGIALGTKPNALLLPFVFAVWWLLQPPPAGSRNPSAWLHAKLHDARRLAGAIPAACGGPLVAFACWPWLWCDGLEWAPPRVMNYLYYLQVVGTSSKSWDLLAPYYLAIVTPPWVLLLALLGVALALKRWYRRDHEGLELLLVCWLLLPLARQCLPFARFYDGIRHFLEVLPAQAMLAGIGFHAVLTEARKWARFAAWPLSVSSAAAMLTPIVLFFPHENVYFNVLVGGYGGARARQIPWACEYWGGSLREAVRWYEVNGEPGSTLVALEAGQVLAQLKVRADLALDADPAAAERLLAEHAASTPMNYYAVEFRTPMPEVTRLGTLVHERTRDGSWVFRVYRISSAHSARR
jgi:4-amino-4-deoxy-L-arabinose transferase-like glycosyltransferase